MSNLRAVRLDWLGRGMRFRAVGAEPATPAIEIDGDGDSGPSPMIALLMAAAGCTAGLARRPLGSRDTQGPRRPLRQRR